MAIIYKKSQLKNWWVAPENEMMQFVNVFDKKAIKNDKLVVVGYINNDFEEFARSTNNVLLITRNYVVTKKGTVYPFNEAHNLYVQFLLLANRNNTIIANRWAKLDDNQMIANVVHQSPNFKIENGVTFDFNPDEYNNGILSGYSDQLKSNIVLSPFNVRNQCLLLGVRDDIKKLIINSTFDDEEKMEKRVGLIRQLKRR